MTAEPGISENVSKPDQSGSAESFPSLRSQIGLLVIVGFLTVVGGYLNAFTYMAHGHVFATAETGNVILFGAALSAGNWLGALAKLYPIGSFVLGMVTAKLLGVHTQKQTFRATLICQGIEIAVLTALAVFAARLSDEVVVSTVAFVSALQVTSFGALGPWDFNSTMTTGNMRRAVSGFMLWMQGHDVQKNRGAAIVSGYTCLSFLTGGVVGTFWTKYDTKHALAPCVALLTAAFLLTWRQGRHNQAQKSRQ